ncbi:MAG: type II toxin-antitoxin system VapC family toxin [Cryobacterium sp.]|nr:type II toxin-antitoxin system VapC family toxin [Cryobacterium sp.]
MAILLDSHALLWMLYNPIRIGLGARHIVERDGTVLVSKASLWELAIKKNIGKLPYDIEEIAEGAEKSNFLDLDIENRHIVNLAKVQLPHRDPWDSMLVAQAQSDALHLLTADRKILDHFDRSIDATK